MQFSHKMKIGIVATVASLAIAGAAFAYFTNSGSGTATGATGTSSALTLGGSITDSMYPGTDSEVTFTVGNSSPGHQILGTIHLASVSVDVPHATCVVADFTMPDVVANEDFATGAAQDVTATGLLSMANTGVTQDPCQGATLTLHLTST